MDGVGDTPQTVMTTRAPAVLKRVKDGKEDVFDCIEILQKFAF